MKLCIHFREFISSAFPAPDEEGVRLSEGKTNLLQLVHDRNTIFAGEIQPILAMHLILFIAAVIVCAAFLALLEIQVEGAAGPAHGGSSCPNSTGFFSRQGLSSIFFP